MLTEFGAMTNATKGVKNIEFLTGIAESKFQSWAYWQFKFFEDLTTQGTGILFSFFFFSFFLFSFFFFLCSFFFFLDH